MWFTVDGVEWNVPCDIKRQEEVKASDVSGMLMNRMMLIDPLGTYLQYDIKLIPNRTQMGNYYALRSVLTQPVGSHTFELPYDEDYVTMVGYLSPIYDVYVRLPNGAVYWKGIHFTVYAVAPNKTPDLNSYGLPEYPPDYAPEEGDTYAWSSANGWEQVSNYENADSIAF